MKRYKKYFRDTDLVNLMIGWAIPVVLLISVNAYIIYTVATLAKVPISDVAPMSILMLCVGIWGVTELNITLDRGIANCVIPLGLAMIYNVELFSSVLYTIRYQSLELSSGLKVVLVLFLGASLYNISVRSNTK